MWLMTAILCAALIEIALRAQLLLTLKRMSVTSMKAMHVLSSSRISDHWKERTMLIYSRTLFYDSAKLALIFGSMILTVVLFDAIADQIERDYMTFLLDWPAILYSICIGALYMKFLRPFFAKV